MMNEFWRSGQLPKGSNVAFIALIAKVDNPTGFHEYRPISMVGAIYKIIAKTLTTRLKAVIWMTSWDLISLLSSKEGKSLMEPSLRESCLNRVKEIKQRL